MAIVFYDTETTGTAAEFDQILQFGAIRTDDDLNEIERFEVRSRLLSHVVPAPGALLVTGISPEVLLDTSLPSHFEMARQIAEKIRLWAPVKYIGHNSLEFDENFLRQTFFQTLLPIYATNTNGNVRGDALNILRGVHLHHPGTLKVPINARGNPTFSLATLAPANGYAHERAHDAMADVEATIFLCRLVKERQPKFWRAMLATMAKKGVVDICEQSELLHLTTFHYGKLQTNILKYLGEANGTHVGFDIANAPEDYINTDVKDLQRQIEENPRVVRTFYLSCPLWSGPS